MTHIDTTLDSSMKESFDKGIHLFTINDYVDNHSNHCIRNLNFPIAPIIIKSVKRKYHVERDEEYLELELLITVGARVMLTSNIWIDAGFIIGALGVIQHIVYNHRSSPQDPPTYVLVIFYNYAGVPWDESIPQVVRIKLIEICKNKKNFS